MTKPVVTDNRLGRPKAFDREQALRHALALFWKQGFATTSVAALCATMGINPPSLYATFGNKEALFIEAVTQYEHTYWDAPSERFLREPDVRKAVAGYFSDAARILLAKETPCGCMVVLSAINVPDTAVDVKEAVRALREATKELFATRLRQAVQDGQLPGTTHVPSLAAALSAFLEGLSLQARDGCTQEELSAIACQAIRLLPEA